jgi:protein SCO1/2
MLRYSLVFIVVGILSGGCNDRQTQLPYYNTPDFTPHWIKDEATATKLIDHRIADFTLTDQEGKAITTKETVGKIHVANFFFTSCPSICPKMTNHFSEIQKEFQNNEEVMLLSFSVTPWVDSVARLKEFAHLHSIQSNKWHLLTGDKNKINTLARKSYFAEEEPGFSKDSTEFLHTENFILVDKQSRIRGIYKGTLALDTKRLIEDIKILQAE